MKGIYVITIAFLASWTEITAKENQSEWSVWKVGFYVEDIPKICPFPEKDLHTTTNLAHETDCTKFYKCFLGEGVLQYCPLMTKGDPITRLHYNSREQVCDWRWRAACVHCPEQDENGNWPPNYKISHETDKCGKYYNCIKGEKHLEYCPAGTCFSRTCQECVQDPRGGKCGGCIEGEKTRHESKCNLYYMCINGKNTLQSCTNGLYFDSSIKDCTCPEISDCPYKCIEGEKTRHETKCNLYYECINGKYTPRSCTNGLYFDSKIKDCTSPKISDCPYKCIEGEKTRHESKCNLYYECINGKYTPRSCTNGLYFDSKIKDCTSPKISDCPYKCIEGEKTRHESKCNLYYECINGKYTLRSCTNGLYFDSKIKDCTSPKISDCPYKCIEDEKTYHECKCNLYYECINGEQTRQSCADYRHFDSRIKNCTSPAKSDCPYPNCIEGEKTYDVCNYCHLYYECKNGENTQQFCPDGLHFDSRSQNCTTPDKSDCQKQCIEGEKTRHECKYDIYYECINGKKAQRFCPDGFHFDFTTQRCTI